jgi:malonate-semialdehyde dehydrogenase (acetylating)/methylmalonate-semialdehyde dehydrogenase
VLLVICVKTMDETIQLINDNEFGNGTYIFTRDRDAARYFLDHPSGNDGY